MGDIFSKITGIALICFMIFVFIVSCAEEGDYNTSSPNWYDGESDTYRRNVEDISDEYDMSPEDVDAKLRALTGGK